MLPFPGPGWDPRSCSQTAPLHGSLVDCNSWAPHYQLSLNGPDPQWGGVQKECWPSTTISVWNFFPHWLWSPKAPQWLLVAWPCLWQLVKFYILGMFHGQLTPLYLSHIPPPSAFLPLSISFDMVLNIYFPLCSQLPPLPSCFMIIIVFPLSLNFF